MYSNGTEIPHPERGTLVRAVKTPGVWSVYAPGDDWTLRGKHPKYWLEPYDREARAYADRIIHGMIQVPTALLHQIAPNERITPCPPSRLRKVP